VPEVDAFDADRAAVGLLDAGRDAQQRRASRSPTAPDADDLAGVHVERDVVERRVLGGTVPDSP